MINDKLFMEYTNSIKNNKGIRDTRYLHLRKSLEFIGDKNLAYLSPNEMYDLIVNKFKVDDAEVLNNYYSFYSNYLNWYIQTQNDSRAANVFNSESLSFGFLMKGISTNTRIFTEDDIIATCNSVANNKIYVETVIRCFYEGFINVLDMINLTTEMIDYKDKVIVLDEKRKIKASDRLMYCLETLRHENTWIQGNNAVKRLSLIQNNSIFKYVENVKSSLDVEKRKTSCKVFISKNIVTKYNIERKQVYISGIIAYMKSLYTDDQIYEMILTETKSDVSELNKISQDYGCNYVGKKLRYMLKPYIMKMKYESTVNE